MKMRVRSRNIVDLLQERREEPMYIDNFVDLLYSSLDKYVKHATGFDNYQHITPYSFKITSDRSKGTVRVEVGLLNSQNIPSQTVATNMLNLAIHLGNANGWYELLHPQSGFPIRLHGQRDTAIFAPNPHPNSDRREYSLLHNRPYLYHATNKQSLQNIILKGLTPRPSYHQKPIKGIIQSGGWYPPANAIHHVIYVGETLNIAQDIFRIKYPELYSKGEMIILRIITSKLPVSIKFFQDPQTDGGYYTNSPIPASALEEIH